MKNSRLRSVLIHWLVLSKVNLPLILIGILYAKTEFKNSLLEFLNLLCGNIGAVNKTNFTISVLPIIFILVATVRITHSLFSDIFYFIFGNLKLKYPDDGLLSLRRISELILSSLAEELIFRGGFLGLMPLIFKGSGDYYVLFLLSSVFFAAVHFFLFKPSASVFLRSVYTIGLLIPGLFFGFVFIKFGMVAVWITHALCNVVAILVNRSYQSYMNEVKILDSVILPN